MKIKIVILRKKLNLESFKLHLRRLYIYLNKNIKSRYVSIQTMVSKKNSNHTTLLGKRFILDLESYEEKKFYIDYVTSIYVESDNVSNLKSIRFQYIESSETQYDSFIKEIIKNQILNTKENNIKLEEIL